MLDRRALELEQFKARDQALQPKLRERAGLQEELAGAEELLRAASERRGELESLEQAKLESLRKLQATKAELKTTPSSVSA